MADTINTLTKSTIPRDQLASFLPNPRLVRDFENVQSDIISNGSFTAALQASGLLTVTASSVLTGQRVLTAGSGIGFTDGGANGAFTVALKITATTPIVFTPATATFSLSTVPIALGGTGQITAPLAFNALAPSQAGNAGKYLTTDGTNARWGTVTLNSLLPTQTGNSGKFLTTDGTNASWGTPSSGGGGGGAPVTKPLIANFTVINLGGGTVTDGVNALFVKNAVASGDNLTLVETNATIPATPYTAATKIETALFSTNVAVGLYLRNSSTGKIVTFGYYSGGWAATLWNSQTSASGNVFIGAALAVGRWLRIKNDGTTLTFGASDDGYDFIDLGSTALSAFIGSVDRSGMYTVKYTSMMYRFNSFSVA